MHRPFQFRLHTLLGIMLASAFLFGLLANAGLDELLAAVFYVSPGSTIVRMMAWVFVAIPVAFWISTRDR